MIHSQNDMPCGEERKEGGRVVGLIAVKQSRQLKFLKEPETNRREGVGEGQTKRDNP